MDCAITHFYKPSFVRWSLILVAIYGLNFNAFAGEKHTGRNIDSLLLLAKSQASDTNKVITLYRLAREYWFETNYTKAVEYAGQSQELAEQLGHQHGIAVSTRIIGEAYTALASYPKALEYLLVSLSKAVEIRDYKTIRKNYSSIGLVYQALSKHSTAIEYFDKALKIATDSKDTSGLAATYQNIGISQTYLNLARRAIENFRKSIALYQSIGDRENVASCHINIGNLYESQKKTEDAIKEYALALETMQQIGYKGGIAKCYNNLGSAYRLLNQHATAIRYLKASIGVSVEIGAANILSESYRIISECYANMNNFEDAYRFHTKHKALNDSIFNQENSRLLSEQKVKYEVEKKEAEMDSKVAYEKKSKQNSVIVLIIIASITVIVVIVLFQRRIAKKEMQMFKAVLESQEIERERIGRDLHDSIGPLLSATKLMLEGVRMRSPEKDKSSFIQVNDVLDKAVKGVREASHDLVPTILLKEGLCQAVAELCEQINTSGLIAVNYNYSCNKPIELYTTRNIYRIVQELLNNAVKHSGATQLDVELDLNADNKLSISVSDNGKGFDVQNIHNGIGLRNISSRVALLEGEVDIDSQLGKGTKFTITIPEVIIEG